MDGGHRDDEDPPQRRAEAEAVPDPDAVVLELTPKRDFDFGFLSAAQTYEIVLLDRIVAVPYSQAQVLVRLHAKDASVNSSVELILRDMDPTCEDGSPFVGTTDLVSALVTAGTTAPSLVRAAMAQPPGPFLRAVLRGTGGSSAKATYTLSADLLLRRAPEVPAGSTRHCFAYSGTTKTYVPINSLTPGTITTLQCGWTAPADGMVAEVTVQSTGTPGDTIISVHKNGSGTAVESKTVTMSVANTPYVFTFSANTFVRGDKLHIGYDPSAASSNVFLTVRYRYSRI
jgi:hypothetical protein